MRPRNEALDCFVYAIAAYSIIGVNVNTIRLPAAQQSKAQSQRTPTRPRKGGWVNSWR